MATRIAVFHPTSTGFSLQLAVARLLPRLGEMARVRATRRLLAEMEPRLLADIGVSRGDAAMEASRPFWDVGQNRLR